MGDLGELEAALAVARAEGGAQVPLRICEACVAALPVTGAAVSVLVGADLREMVCATDELAGQLEELQFCLGEGPCVEGSTEGRPVLVADLAQVSDGRWPVFAAQARLTPARAVFVFPLQVGAVRVGVLNLYHLDPGTLGTDDLSGALLTADAALGALLDLRSSVTLGSGDILDGDEIGWPLHRTEVYQATGMVMEQLKVAAETALARLRGLAFVEERPIDEVARDVVARRTRFDEEEDS